MATPPISPPHSPPATVSSFRPGAETLPFAAETSRLMDILVHSLYSNRDIFLRELISNSADALDKARFLDLQRASGGVAGRESGSDAPAPTLSPETAEAVARTPLEIRIAVDPAAGTLTILDSGVGMTRAEAIANLGTIAKSGTGAFLETATGRQGAEGGADGSALGLIGQFGVGFYSVYLVADYVSVTTRIAGGEPVVWESRASGVYAVSPATNEDLAGAGGPASLPVPPRGTRITLHLKEDAREYLEASKLRDLVKKYSEFVPFPISLWIEGDATASDGDARDDDPLADKPPLFGEDDEEAVFADEDGDGDDGAPAAEDAPGSGPHWSRLNEAQAVWLRPPSEVTEEEHAKFYRILAREEEGLSAPAGAPTPPASLTAPLAHTHFKAEGEVEFRALLYVPPAPPPDAYESFYVKEARLKLYVRRVFVSDAFEELLPKWLSFLVGLVDSDTLPINVSREVLRVDAGIKTIRKKLTRKAIDMLVRLSRDDVRARKELDEIAAAPAAEEGGEGERPDAPERVAALKAQVEAYSKFWKGFGKSVKMGLIDEREHRRRLLPLLRFTTTDSAGKDDVFSLDEYLERMVPGQKHVYYLVGLGQAEVESSPYLESLARRNVSVITFTDAIDEYVMAHVTEYEDKEFVNVAKEELKLDEIDREAKRAELLSRAKARAEAEGISEEAALEAEEGKDRAEEAERAGREGEAKERRAAALKKLTAWWKRQLRSGSPFDGADSVRLSKRLETRPCVVVASKHGWTPQMERIARAQALGEGEERARSMRGGRVLEINPDAPVVADLATLVEADPKSPAAAAAARALFETCLVESGYVLDDLSGFTLRLQDFVTRDVRALAEKAEAAKARAEAEAEAEPEPEPTGEDAEAEPEATEGEHDEL